MDNGENDGDTRGNQQARSNLSLLETGQKTTKSSFMTLLDVECEISSRVLYTLQAILQLGICSPSTLRQQEATQEGRCQVFGEAL